MTAAASGAAWGPGTSLDRVYAALQQAGCEPKGGRDDFFALCPVHDESTPSLHITYASGGREGGGKVALMCHGCDARAPQVVEALGLTLADLFDDPPPVREQSGLALPQRRRGPSRRQRLGPLPKRLVPRSGERLDHEHDWETADVYHYSASDGEERHQVRRLVCTVCATKSFRQAYVSGEDLLETKPEGFTPVLYRQPEVVAAIARHEPVWLLEGEKDVHTAEQLGLVACTNAGGAKAFPAELARLFDEADLNVVVDRDAAGRRRAVTVYDLIAERANRVRIWLPATTAPKSDFTDHIDAGYGGDDLIAISIAEVRARSAADGLDEALPKILECNTEGHAQTAAAEERRHSAAAAARQHVQNARRWAKEAEIRWERFADAADQVLDQLNEAAENGWADRVANHIVDVIDQALSAVRGSHESAGIGMADSIPARARQLTAKATPPEPEASEEAGELVDGPWIAQPPEPTAPVRTGEVLWPRYVYLDGGIVRVTEKERRDGSIDRKFEAVINVEVRLEVKEYEESEEEIDTAVTDLMTSEYTEEEKSQFVQSERQVAAYIYSYPHPRTGERMQLRVAADRATSGDWLDSIDVPGLNFARDRRGRQEVVRAIEVLSTGATSRTQARGTGWRQDPEHGWVYTHYAGQITAEGWKPSAAAFSGVLHRYALPRPSTDPARLRTAFLDHSAAIMTRISHRLGGALLAAAYKAPFERVPYTSLIVGNAGSGKTGLASLVMHHFGPAWDRNTPTASMTENGATALARTITAHEARDALGVYDNVTPGDNYSRAQTQMGRFLHSMFGQEARDRGTRDHGQVSGHRPWITPMLTSELMPRAGADARRAIILPIAKTELPIDEIIALDAPTSRWERSLLTASMLQWAAGDLEQIRAWIRDVRVDYTRLLRTQGRTSEEAEYGGHLWSGWAIMTRFLHEAGSLTEDERQAWLDRAHTAIADVMESASDPDQPTNPGVRALEALRSALRAGDLHLTQATDNRCPQDEALAVRLGWIPQQVGNDPVPRYQLTARSSSFRMGYVKLEESDPEVLIDGESLERALKIAGAGLAEPIQADKGTIRRWLHDIGALKVESRGESRQPLLTLKRVLPAEATSAGRPVSRRMTVLRLTALLGDEDSHGHGGADPAPLPPTPALPGATPTDSSAALVATTAPGNEPHNGIDPIGEAMIASETAQRLEHPTDCIVCHTPTTYALDGVPLHPRCWGEVNNYLDRTTETENTEPTPPVDTSSPAPAQPPAKTNTVTTSRQHRSASPQQAANVLIDVDAIHMPDGSTRPVPEIRHIGDIAQIGIDLRLGYQVRKGFSEAGTLVISTRLCDQLDIPIADLPPDGARRSKAFSEATTDHPFLLGALTEGWMVAKSAQTSLRAWTRVWREGHRPLTITFEPLLPPGITGGSIDTAAIAKRLERFTTALGFSYRVSPSSTGFDLMESLRWRDRDRLFHPHEPVTPALGLGDPDLNWSRKPTAEELKLPYVHVYDRGGSYIAGVAGLELPEGDPDHHPDGTEFDSRVPGYWLVDLGEAADWRYPHPMFTIRNRERDWVTTPTLDLAISLGYEPTIHEAYTWPAHSRLLDTWQSRIRDARTTLDTTDVDDQAARSLLKQTYTRTIGMMGSSQYMKSSRHYWPERRHHIVAKARANLLRQILTIGNKSNVWPLAVRTDSIMYASAEADPAKAWPGDAKKAGRGFGQYKPERTGLLADQLPYLTGGHWEGKQHLDQVGDAEDEDAE